MFGSRKRDRVLNDQHVVEQRACSLQVNKKDGVLAARETRGSAES